MSNVIAAVSTGNQISAIGILRLTGDGCAEVAGKVFTLNNGTPLCQAPNRKLMLGELKDAHIRVTYCAEYDDDTAYLDDWDGFNFD